MRNEEIVEIDKLEYFELKEEHIKLLSKSYVQWFSCETGAACIDPKRPYGNSYVPPDIAEILEIDKEGITTESEDEDWEYTEKGEEMLLKIHYETYVALQIILITKSFVPGFFMKTDKFDSMKWERITKEDYIARKI